MAAIMEPIFSIAYLITVITLGCMMVVQSQGNRNKILFGIMAIILGSGDAFHLVPRIIGLITDTMDMRAASLGFGKLINVYHHDGVLRDAVPFLVRQIP